MVTNVDEPPTGLGLGYEGGTISPSRQNYVTERYDGDETTPFQPNSAVMTFSATNLSDRIPHNGGYEREDFLDSFHIYRYLFATAGSHTCIVE